MIKTDWDNVAHWYDEYLQGDDTYQEKVIAPNLMRLIDPKKGERILDVACGQGYFARRIATTGATVIGIDQSKELIAKATAEGKGNFFVGNAEMLGKLNIGTFNTVFSVLALENIKNTQAVLECVAQILKKEGRIVLVMLHPAFRIPKHSDWGYSKEKDVQFRKVDVYLSESAIPIELSPFKNTKKEKTVTFHRSLQWYMKTFRSAGFAITGLEEWISHKKSQPGPRQNAEDVARKEFPMFLALELRKF